MKLVNKDTNTFSTRKKKLYMQYLMIFFSHNAQISRVSFCLLLPFPFDSSAQCQKIFRNTAPPNNDEDDNDSGGGGIRRPKKQENSHRSSHMHYQLKQNSLVWDSSTLSFKTLLIYTQTVNSFLSTSSLCAFRYDVKS